MKKTFLASSSKKLTSISLAIALGSLMIPTGAFAASVSDITVQLSNNATGALSNTTIYFSLPTGMSAGNMLDIQFGDSNTTDFNLSDLVTAAVNGYKNVDVAVSTDSTSCATSANYTEKTTLSGDINSSTGWVSIFQTDASTDHLYLVPADDTVTAAKCMRVKVGLNAVTSDTSTIQITNGSTTGSKPIYISTKISPSTPTVIDTGTAYAPLVASGDVTVTASVSSSITLTVADTSITMPTTLSASDVTTSATTADAIAVAISGGGTGFTLQAYTPLTLTSGSNTIAAQTAKGTGSAGTAGWGINLELGSAPGSATIASDYDYGTTPTQYLVKTAGPDTMATSSVATSSNFTLHAYARSANDTPAGTYNGTVRVTAFGNF